MPNSTVQTDTKKMKRKIESPQGCYYYGLRLRIMESVFAHIKAIKKMNRFTLRGEKKVDIQRKLFCIVFNIAKNH